MVLPCYSAIEIVVIILININYMYTFISQRHKNCTETVLRIDTVQL